MAIKFFGRQGFTLIELMVAVAIISLLAAIAIPNYYNFICKAKQSEAKDFLGVMARCQEAYFIEYNTFSGSKDKIGFETRGIPYYTYKIVLADHTCFDAKASAYFSGKLDNWVIDETMIPNNESNACRK